MSSQVLYACRSQFPGQPERNSNLLLNYFFSIINQPKISSPKAPQGGAPGIDMSTSQGNPPTTDVGFVQQGSVDWVSFSKSTVSMSVEILARFQAAGVQEVTYAGALQLTTRFALHGLGRQRLWDALHRLDVYKAPANLLYFGFGHRSFLRFLSETVSGLKCIALCSSLAEMHSEDVAARIMSSLWGEFGYPEDIEPSHHQFKCLIRACGGALAKSPFPEMASRMLGADWNLFERLRSECSEPEDTAKTLRALFEITRGVRDSVTVVGGIECSFIAAISHWLFDLSLFVEDGDGNPLFVSSTATTPTTRDSSQVHIRYMDSSQLSSAVVTQSTFVLRDPQEMLIHTPDSRLRCIRTRVSWEICLNYTFGQSFQDLLSHPTVFGQILGGAARIYKALAESEPDVSVFSRLDFVDFCEASHGAGFIRSTGEIFAELASPNLSQAMQASLSTTIGRAVSLIAEAIFALRRRCLCPICDTSNRTYKPEVPCLLALTTTIIELITTIASTHREAADNLCPNPAGLAILYKRNYTNFRLAGGSRRGEFLYLVLGLKSASSDASLRPKNMASIMANPICVFTGYELSQSEQESYNWRTAVCENGICVFMEGLVSMTARPELLRRVHIIPGHIARGARVYESIWDVAHTPPPDLQSIDLQPGAQIVENPSQGAIPEKGDMTALVSEPGGPGQLSFFYRVSIAHKNVIILPGRITASVLKHSGRIPCRRSNCPTVLDALAPSLFTVTEGWLLSLEEFPGLISHGNACCNWEYIRTSEVARLAAIALCRAGYNGLAKEHALMRRDECLPCCTRACHEIAATDPAEQDARHIFHLI